MSFNNIFSILKYQKMKNIFFLIIFINFFSLTISAQPADFYTKTWRYKEYSISYRNKTSIMFHKDSVNNLLDYSKIEFKFSNNKTYTSKNGQGKIFNGSWAITTRGDSVFIDSFRYLIVKLDPAEYIIRAYSLQLADTTGRVDTAYSFVKLYPISSTSIQDKLTLAGIKIYPIPTSNMLYIENEENKLSINEIRIVNIYGQIIKTFKSTDKSLFSINTTDWISGIYWVEILDKERKSIGVKKIIKQ